MNDDTDVQYKSLVLAESEMKDGPSGHGRLFGYAATFGNLDLVGDVIEPGAFAKTLPAFLRDGFVALNHSADGMPVATIDSATEDRKGLWTEIDFHSHDQAQQARRWAQERLNRGKSLSLSIGYRVPQGGAERREGARYLKEIDLREISLVNMPANPLALVSGVKGILPDGMTYADHLDSVLAAVEGTVTRGSEILALRQDRKAGRMLSARNVSKLRGMGAGLRELLEQLDTLIDAALGEPEGDEPPSMGAGGKSKSQSKNVSRALARYRKHLAAMEDWVQAEGILKFEPRDEQAS